MGSSLSIVLPVYNEPDHAVQAISALSEAVLNSPFADRVELVVVDDGSSAATVAALEAASVPFDKRILRQQNLGRFQARQRGIEAATNDFVLLVDVRIRLAPDALSFVAGELDAGHSIWNGHVDIELARNPFARFWNVLTEVGFREYFSNPRTTSFGIEEFDLFPKGTGCFLAPRALLLEAIANFTSVYEDARHSSDDTTLIRWLAGQDRIWISPNFRCRYRPRDAFKPFVRHAYNRGIHFPDSFGPGTRFFPVVVAFYPVSLASLAFAIRRPRLAAKLSLGTPAVAAAATLAVRRSIRDAATLAWLAPLFTVVYGAGIWRGLWLMLQARWRRSPS